MSSTASVFLGQRSSFEAVSFKHDRVQVDEGSVIMSPTQQRVELDQDRKEELILAKQLRACRVQILPKVRLRIWLCRPNSFLVRTMITAIS